MKVCPACQGNNDDAAKVCMHCGTSISSVSLQGFLTGALVVLALACFLLGWILPQSAIQQMTWFGSACALGILGRIAQASAHKR